MFEIMACGVPIVASVRGESRAILARSGAARLVEPENASALAQAIEWMEAHPRERERMGVVGRAFVCEHYDRWKMADQYARVLTGIVK